MSDSGKRQGTDAIGQVWIGASAPIQWVKTQLKEVADTDLPVLIVGEPGTGKRLAARTVHALSARRDQLFVQADCAALHQTRMESELFAPASAAPAGHAHRLQARSEQAHGGTLFLDEVDALAPDAQTRLLQLLKEGRARGVDMRLISATQRDLGRMARAGMFCPELYYRLSIVPVKLPPLRERRKDIPLLAMHFVRQCAARMRQEIPDLSQEAMTVLLAYDWSGNVWELKRTLERAVVLSRQREIRPEHIQQPFQSHLQESRPPQAGDPFLFGISPADPPGPPELN